MRCVFIYLVTFITALICSYLQNLGFVKIQKNTIQVNEIYVILSIIFGTLIHFELIMYELIYKEEGRYKLQRITDKKSQ